MDLETVTARQLLITGVEQLGLQLNDMQITQLIIYATLLIKWNKVYSLTAITDPERVITHHLLDGLSIIKYLGEAKNVVDVGSGMGVPGVIIAICCPYITITAIDCKQKKIAFLQQVAIELNLVNMYVANVRIENYVAKSQVDLVVARAFADSLTFIKLIKGAFKKGTKILLMKSKNITTEIKLLKDYMYEMIPLTVPGIDEERCLLKIEL